MTRVAESQLIGQMLYAISKNRKDIAKYSDEITTGLKVQDPGDSNLSGTISQFNETLTRMEGHKSRVSTVRGLLVFQDDIMSQMGELLIRAKEIAEQAANETNSDVSRAHMAEEVFEIRDHVVQLANSTYQGRYVYGGTDDDDPPYDPNTYTNPATGAASQRYVHDGENGTTTTRTVNITDDLSIVTNTAGSDLFNNSIWGLERLGRALSGYDTNPATGQPDGTGNAFTFPADFTLQTQDIRDALNILDDARNDDIIPERVDLGGRMRRLDTAESLLELATVNAQELLGGLQNADVVESASNLSRAETALQASFTVSSRVLNLTILDYI